MSTSYTDIYPSFLRKINDFDLPQFTDDELEAYCQNILKSALVKLTSINNDLSEIIIDENTGEEMFASDLTYYEIEMIAGQMVVEWIDSELNNTQLIRMFVGTKDETMASQANHIEKLITLKEKQRAEVSMMMRDYAYRTWVKEEDI